LHPVDSTTGLVSVTYFSWHPLNNPSYYGTGAVTFDPFSGSFAYFSNDGEDQVIGTRFDQVTGLPSKIENGAATTGDAPGFGVIVESKQ
jgi:hypothetical protein